MCATVLSKTGGRGVPDSQEAGLERNEMHTDSGDADTPRAPGEANNASFMDFFCTMVCMLQMRTRVGRPLGIPPSVLLFLGIFPDIHTAQPRTYITRHAVSHWGPLFLCIVFSLHCILLVPSHSNPCCLNILRVEYWPSLHISNRLSAWLMLLPHSTWD